MNVGVHEKQLTDCQGWKIFKELGLYELFKALMNEQ